LRYFHSISLQYSKRWIIESRAARYVLLQDKSVLESSGHSVASGEEQCDSTTLRNSMAEDNVVNALLNDSYFFLSFSISLFL